MSAVIASIRKRLETGLIRHGSCLARIHGAAAALETPTVLFRSNHLLVVSKPAGWQTIDHNSPSQQQETITTEAARQRKCLWRYLRASRLGGGSEASFLRPLHRIDQPCSGLVMYGMTSRLTRILPSKWKDVVAEKEYRVVVRTAALDKLRVGSAEKSSWMTCRALLGRKRQSWKTQQNPSSTRGWSVSAIALQPYETVQPDDGGFRLCQLDWKPLDALSASSSPFTILRVRTTQGTRHVVRALLACHGCSVEGDLRYGSSNAALPDQSVSLHAYRLQFGFSKLLRPQSLRGQSFCAPVPDVWKDFFGFVPAQLR